MNPLPSTPFISHTFLEQEDSLRGVSQIGRGAVLLASVPNLSTLHDDDDDEENNDETGSRNRMLLPPYPPSNFSQHDDDDENTNSSSHRHGSPLFMSRDPNAGALPLKAQQPQYYTPLLQSSTLDDEESSNRRNDSNINSKKGAKGGALTPLLTASYPGDGDEYYCDASYDNSIASPAPRAAVRIDGPGALYSSSSSPSFPCFSPPEHHLEMTTSTSDAGAARAGEDEDSDQTTTQPPQPEEGLEEESLVIQEKEDEDATTPGSPTLLSDPLSASPSLLKAPTGSLLLATTPIASPSPGVPQRENARSEEGDEERSGSTSASPSVHPHMHLLPQLRAQAEARLSSSSFSTSAVATTAVTAPTESPECHPPYTPLCSRARNEHLSPAQSRCSSGRMATDEERREDEEEGVPVPQQPQQQQQLLFREVPVMEGDRWATNDEEAKPQETERGGGPSAMAMLGEGNSESFTTLSTCSLPAPQSGATPPAPAATTAPQVERSTASSSLASIASSASPAAVGVAVLDGADGTGLLYRDVSPVRRYISPALPRVSPSFSARREEERSLSLTLPDEQHRLHDEDPTVRLEMTPEARVSQEVKALVSRAKEEVRRTRESLLAVLRETRDHITQHEEEEEEQATAQQEQRGLFHRTPSATPPPVAPSSMHGAVTETSTSSMRHTLPAAWGSRSALRRLLPPLAPLLRARLTAVDGAGVSSAAEASHNESHHDLSGEGCGFLPLETVLRVLWQVLEEHPPAEHSAIASTPSSCSSLRLLSVQPPTPYARLQTSTPPVGGSVSTRREDEPSSLRKRQREYSSDHQQDHTPQKRRGLVTQISPTRTLERVPQQLQAQQEEKSLTELLVVLLGVMESEFGRRYMWKHVGATNMSRHDPCLQDALKAVNRMKKKSTSTVTMGSDEGMVHGDEHMSSRLDVAEELLMRLPRLQQTFAPLSQRFGQAPPLDLLVKYEQLTESIASLTNDDDDESSVR